MTSLCVESSCLRYDVGRPVMSIIRAEVGYSWFFQNVSLYFVTFCHISQDSSFLSNKFVLNTVLLMFFKAMAIGSIQNAHVDTVCPPRKIEGPHSFYRFSLLEWKSSNSVVMIKIYG